MLDIKPIRITYTYKQKNLGPPSKVFPLLCPVRDKELAPDFDADMIYSESGVAEENCIFMTKGHNTSDDVWVITKYDPINFFIEMLHIIHEIELITIQCKLDDNFDDTTTTTITYIYTSLSKKGNQSIEAFTEEKFKFSMISWEIAINYYLKNGTMIPVDKLALHIHKK